MRDGLDVRATPRQIEVLTLLALHPDGLGLETLHAHVYGDREVRRATLKAEISHLRDRLRGGIGSRPYRLEGAWSADCVEVLERIRAGNMQSAVILARGLLVPHSVSPKLEEWRQFIEIALRESVLRAGDLEALWRYAERHTEDLEVWLLVSHQLAEVDVRVPLVRARIRLILEHG
jgi:hypothetical protein